MKKFVSMLLVSAMLITALTACDSNNANDSDSNPSSSSTATGGGDSTSTDGESSASDSSSDNESSTTEDSVSTPDDSASDPEDSTPDDTSEPAGVDNSALPFPDNKAGNMAKTALATDNWPAMDIIADQEILDVMFPYGLTLENLEEHCITTNVISAQLYNVIVIKPKAGSESEAEAAIAAYAEALKTDPNLTFYPGQEASAQGAVNGKTDDGYYYIIVHENGADIESAMLAAV